MICVDLVQREVDAVVGDAALREVVGADALGAVAAADQAICACAASLACCSRTCASMMRAASTDMACALFLCCERSSWHSTTMPVGRWVMRTAESVLLMCWPPAPEARKVSMRRSAGLMSTSAEFVRFRHHRDGAGGGVDAALGFGLRHALHAVAAGFELELGIGALADDAGDDFLVAAHFARAFRHDLDLPALALGIARVHAEQVAGEQRRFVAAGAGADFQEDVALVVGVLGQQQLLQIDFDLRQLRLALSAISASANSFISGSASISWAVVQVLLALAARRWYCADHRREFGMFARQLAVVVHVAT